MKKNIDRYILILIIVVILIMLFFYMKNTLTTKNNDLNNNIDNNVSNNIEMYGYTLKNNKSDLYKIKFNELNELLKSEKYNELDYLKLISEMFIIDFYTLDKKISNTDIGGIDFVYSNIKDNFSLKATETVYKYVQNSIYGNLTDELPIVKNVEIINVKEISYSYENRIDKSAYQVDVSWEYEKDFGYETKKTLYFVHEDKKISLVEMK